LLLIAPILSFPERYILGINFVFLLGRDGRDDGGEEDGSERRLHGTDWVGWSRGWRGLYRTMLLRLDGDSG
jgi:hypothetical protein